MSNITTDFIAATKKIHADVRAILISLRLMREDVKFIRDQHAAANEQVKSREEHPFNIAVVASGENAVPDEGEQDTLHEKRYRLEEKTFNVGKRTLVVLAIYTLLTAYQSWQAKRTADATVKAAEAAEQQIKATAEQFRQDQRAWIGVQSMAIRIPMDPEQPIAAQAGMVNFGKTFAQKVAVDFSLLFTHEERDIAAYVKHRDPNVSVQGDTPNAAYTASLPPNIPYPLNVSYQDPANTGASLKLRKQYRQLLDDWLKERKYFIYLYGNISYSDVFGQLHHTTFCGEWNPSVNGFDNCTTYNDAD